MDFDKLDTILESGSKEELAEFMASNNLTIKDDKIVHAQPEKINEEIAFWDKRQLVKKINLNS